MSEEKLYVLKNDEGEYWEFNDLGGFWELLDVAVPFTVSEEDAKKTAKEHGGHVVTLIEEPEKVVLTKEQAEIVEGAHEATWPATCISGSGDSSEQRLLIEAYVNGWTVKRPQRWYVKTPDNWMGNGKQGWLYKITGVINTISEDHRECTPGEQFSAEEISYYGLQDYEKEEVNDDGE